MSKELEILKRKVGREIKARLEAEKLLEEKSLALFQVNQSLTAVNDKLSELVEERTQKLKKSEQEYQALVESISDLICKTTLDGVVTYINPVVTSLTGYTKDELIGNKIFFLLDKDWERQCKVIFSKKVSQGNCVFYNEVPIVNRAGKMIWLGLNVQFFSEKCMTCNERFCAIFNNLNLQSNVNCEYKEVIIVARDITAQKQTNELLISQSRNLEKGLRQQELLSEIALELNTLDDFDRRINKVIRFVGEHIATGRVYVFEDFNKGEQTRIAYEWCNENVPSVKWKMQDISYRAVPSLKKMIFQQGKIFSDNIEELPGDLRKILNSYQVKSIVIYPIYIKGIQYGFIGFDESIKYKKLHHYDLELLRTVSGIVANAFERKIMEQSIINERDKANRANEAKSQFLANMSHEIRTPMNAILGFSEALYDKIENKGNKTMVKSILSSGNLLLSLLNDILDLSKIEAGKMDIVPRLIDLTSVVKDIKQLYLSTALQKGIQLTIDISSAFPDAMLLDEMRIKQVLFNLIGNAIKFTHSGYVLIKLHLNKERKGYGTLFIDIEDTGIGMHSSQCEVVFEAFKQHSGQASRKYGGAGLGLAISKRLVEKMGGVISVKSKEGEGSVFTVTLPKVKIYDKMVVPEKNHNSRKVLFAPSRMLIVDDVLSNIKIIETLLVNSGIEIIAVTDCKKVLDTYEQTKPDVVLLDLMLPQVSGFELARKIRETYPNQKSVIIAYTASVFHDIEINQSKFFDDFLFKPVTYKEVVDVLQKYLGGIKNPLQIKEARTPLKIEYTLQTKEKWLNIKPLLQNEFIPQWSVLKDHLVLYKIESFAERLVQLADQYEFPLLKDYALQLIENVENVDLDSLKSNLYRFPDFISRTNKALIIK